jgi:voltage-gated potassium channel
VPVPASIVGLDFVAAANVFLPDRTNMKACLLIGIFRGDTMMLNPVGGEAGPLREGDQLILLSQNLPDLSRLQTAGTAVPNEA